jgi:hypothetical protein
MTQPAGFLCAIITATTLLLSNPACKREPTTPAASPNTASGSTGSTYNATASGPGTVVANDKEIVYQNLHIKLPWNFDAVQLIRIGQQAAQGNGLTLAHDATELKISSDGKTLTLNSQPYGNASPNDRITLQSDGKLLVNDIERKSQEPAGR